jgi:hypothetical protein
MRGNWLAWWQREVMAVQDRVQAIADGHRKKVNVAEFLIDELGKRIPRVRLLAVDLTYFLRSGEPGVYDKHMAIFYANLIMSAVKMVCWRDGGTL